MSAIVEGSVTYAGDGQVTATCSACHGPVNARVELVRRPVAPAGEAWFGVQVVDIQHDCHPEGPSGGGERWAVG